MDKVMVLKEQVIKQFSMKLFSKFKFSLFFFVKSKKGSAIIASLISVGVLGFSTVILLQYMQSVSISTNKIAGEKEIAFNIHSQVVNNLKSLLVETATDKYGNKVSNNIYGVCSLLSPIKKRHGVADLKIRLSSNLWRKSARDNFSLKRWETFFNKSEYKIVAENFCKENVEPDFKANYLSRCLQYIGIANQTNAEVYVIARIVPKKLPSFKKINLSQNQEINVEKVLFELQMLATVKNPVTYLNPQSESIINQLSKYYSIVYTNSINQCDVNVQGRWVSVQLSGTGPGRLSDRLIISNTILKTEKQCSEVEFGSISSNVVIGGSRVGNNIMADLSKNIPISCRKNTYRCPGVLGLSSDYDPRIRFHMSILNNHGGTLQFKGINFTVVDNEDSDVDGVDDNKISTLNVSVRDPVGNIFSANTDLVPEKKLMPGQNAFRFHLLDKDPRSLSKFCNKVCSGNDYYPLVSMNFTNSPGKNCNYSRTYGDDKHLFGCTVCHSKICHKVGLGTFGPISDRNGVQGLVDEPLDGTIPECRLSSKSKDYELPTVSTESTGKCVVMELDNVKSFKNFKNATYKYQNCSSTLPVLCFAYGHYLPGIKLTDASSAPAIFTGSFSKAQKACYNMGREIIEKDQLAGFFKNAWSGIQSNSNEDIFAALSNFGLENLSSSNNHFDYVNNASRGLFILPFYNPSMISKRLSEGDSSYLQKFISQGYDKIWVAVEKDAGDQLIGSIPLANIASSPFAIFNRKEYPSKPILLKDISNLPSKEGVGAILIHNMRYKGVYSVSKTTTRYPVLCRKGAGKFALARSTSLKNAPQACRNIRAYFTPPLSSLEWVKALTLLAENDDRYPFPNPGDFSDPQNRERNYMVSISIPTPKQAWVALSQDTATSDDNIFAESWRLSKSHFPKPGNTPNPTKDSVFYTEKVPPLSNDFLGIINARGEPVTLTEEQLKAIATGSSTAPPLKVACVSERGSNSGQFELKPPVPYSANPNCGAGNILLENSSIGENYKFIKSVRFMSEWVQKSTYYSSGNLVINKKLLDNILSSYKDDSTDKEPTDERLQSLKEKLQERARRLLEESAKTKQEEEEKARQEEEEREKKARQKQVSICMEKASSLWRQNSTRCTEDHQSCISECERKNKEARDVSICQQTGRDQCHTERVFCRNNAIAVWHQQTNNCKN